MWVFLVFPVVFFGLSLFMFNSMWHYLREYGARKEEGPRAGQWAKTARSKAVMNGSFAGFFAVLFLLFMWIYFVVVLKLAGWPIVLALLGCFVAIVGGVVLMGRLKSSKG